MSQPPVVVVGAGPVGLTAALLLARRGVPVTVLERHERPYPLPRAVHLDGECLRILQATGVAEDFLPLTRPMAGLRLVDGRLRVLAEFPRRAGPGEQGWPDGVLFRQPELEELLRAAAERAPGITVLDGTQAIGIAQVDDRVEVAVRKGGGERSVTASFVLGCDGANSAVRRWIGARMRDLGRPDRWLVVDARWPAAPPVWPGVHQVSDPGRAATFLPLPGDRFRWEFRLLPGENAADLTKLGRLAELLAPWGARDIQIERAAEYEYRAQIADRWRSGRVLIAGDAAHLTPPFIGQGLGLGLRDAHQLAWKLSAVLRGEAAEDLLDTHQAEREPHARALVRTALLLGMLMTSGGRGAAVTRRGVLAVARRLPVVARLAGSSRTPPLRRGPLVERRGTAGRRLGGTLIPQPTVRADGRECRLDELLGEGCAALRLAGDRLFVRRAGEEEQEIADPSGVLTRWLRGAGATAVVVRPDRIVHEAAP